MIGFLPIVPMGRGTANFGGGGVKGYVSYPSTGFQPVPLPKDSLGRKPYFRSRSIAWASAT